MKNMGDLSEFPIHLRLFLKAYRWRTIDPIPWAPLKKPLSQSRVALGSSAGLVMRDQTPFDDQMRGGDPTFREIPGDAEVSSLVETHRSEAFDHSGLRADTNLGFPLDRMKELEKEGVFGDLNHRHLSFMGSITAPGRLIQRTAPEAAEWLVEDQVDAALLVPV